MTEPLRVLIVDDEPLARATVRQLLERDPEMIVVGECGDGRSAAEAIPRLRPDLVLLDVQMPGADGFQVVRDVGPERMPVVVFITAHDRYALQAFDVGAVDYLLKPFDDERFARTLDRAKRTVRGSRLGDLAPRFLAVLDDLERSRGAGAAPSAQAATQPLTRLVVKDRGRALLIPVADIDWIEAADYMVRVHVGPRVHLIRETMNHIERRLDPRQFFRAHRSTIVNLERIREIQPYFRGEHILVLRDGTRLKLSRPRREKLEELLEQTI